MNNFEDFGKQINSLVQKFMMIFNQYLLNFLVKLSESESKDSNDNTLTYTLHLASLYYATICQFSEKSLLCTAIEQGDIEAGKLLLEMGESINTVNSDGKTPLHIAAANGHVEMVDYLLKKGADCNCLTLPPIETKGDDDETEGENQSHEIVTNQTPLHLAILNNHEEIIKYLLHRWESAIKEAHRQHKLFSTFNSDHQATISMKQLPDLNIKDSLGNTPMYYAAEAKFSSEIDTLFMHVRGILPRSPRSPSPSSPIVGPKSVSPVIPHSESFSSLRARRVSVVKMDNGSFPVLVEDVTVEECPTLKSRQAPLCQTPTHSARESLLSTPLSAIMPSDSESEAMIYPESSSYISSPTSDSCRGFSLESSLNKSIASDDDSYRTLDSFDIEKKPISHSATKRKVSMINQRFEKIETRRASLYRQNSSDSALLSPLINELRNENPFFQKRASLTEEELKEKIHSTTIHEAVTEGSIDLVEKMPDEEMNSLDNENNTPLHYAAAKGRYEIAVLLLRRGGNVRSKNRYGQTPLHLACHSGNEDIVREMINAGSDTNEKDSENNTPLHFAASVGSLKITRLLVESGAQVKIKNISRQTPLHRAAFNGLHEIMLYLVIRGAKIDAQDSEEETPLHLAASRGHTEAVRILLENTKSKKEIINKKNRLKRIPLHEAAYNGNLDVVRQLLIKKIDLDQKDSSHHTPLSLAAAQGHSQVVDLLLEKGAKINSEKKRNSPLHLAALNNHLETVKLLINKGADISAKNNEKDTPLHIAVLLGHVDVARHLISKGADVNRKGNRDLTPLHHAVKSDHIILVSLLLANGADKSLKDCEGKTAVYHAQQKNCVESLAILNGDFFKTILIMLMKIYVLFIEAMRIVLSNLHQCLKSIESKMFSREIVPKFAQTVLLIYLLTTTCARYVKCEDDADDCPDPKDIEPCSCDREGLSCFAPIDEKDLERIFKAKSPYNAYRNVWLMESGSLKKLEKNVFNNNRIQKIMIQLNSLEEIEEGAFEGTYKYVSKLDLWSNRLTKIPISDINKMERLSVLVLAKNLITEIPKGAFKPNKALQVLQLDHNSLEKIETRTFQDSFGLRGLELSENKITEIESDAFAGANQLREIILTNNALTKIGRGAFQKLPDSIKIVLDGNKISKIDEMAFARTRVGVLDLSYNKLEYLEPKIFGKLLQTLALVNVEGNPFTCQGCSKYAWLLDIGAYRKNLVGFKCSDGRRLEDLTPFDIGCA
ncbi:uncharacterized protein LOC141851486 [Brevipalpus obovatus]|uniref:uncharacterized protein LOC141851486 n=1 Tax=Brevipalpus obovatus TaxID=246614 RepID=UPI003D9F012A